MNIVGEPFGIPIEVLKASLMSYPPPEGALGRYASDWSDFLTQIKQKQNPADGKKVSQAEWFVPPSTVSLSFKQALEQAEKIAPDVNSAEGVKAVFEKMEKDDTNRRFYWYLLCRRLSTKPSPEREAVFQAVAEQVGKIISEGVATEIQQERIFSAGKALTTFSTKYGAEAFLLGIAGTNFQNQAVREKTLDFLEDYVHPKIYTPLQWFRAALAVYNEHLAGQPERRQHFNSLWDRMLTPKTEEEFTLEAKDLYFQQTHLDYPKGEEMLPTDLLVIKQAGLEGNNSVLDPAAGEGRHVIELWQEGYKDITAGDYNIKYLRELRARLRQPEAPQDSVKIANLDWQALPFRANKFDFILFIGRDVHHFINSHERRSFFSGLRRVIKKDGTLVLDMADVSVGEYKNMVEESQPLFSGWLPSTEDSHLALDSMDDTHFTLRIFPSLGQMIEDLNKSGFKVKDVQLRYIPNKDRKEEPEARNAYMILEAV